MDTFCSAGSMASVVVPDYTGAPIIKLLNGIARGDDINERNGRQVIMKSVQINMVFRPSSTQANQLPTVVRMMLSLRQADKRDCTYDCEYSGAARQ